MTGLVRLVARLMAIALLRAYIAIRPASNRKWACYWLAHFLEGSGETLRADNRVVYSQEEERDLAEMFLQFARWQIGRDLVPGEHLTGVFTTWDWLVLYQDGEASGFWAKPALFHIVGGFTLSMWIEGGLVYVAGLDVYDWHPNKRVQDPETGEIHHEWYVTPVDVVRTLPNWVRRLANRALGAEVITPQGLVTNSGPS